MADKSINPARQTAFGFAVAARTSACTSAPGLEHAYAEVVDRYHLAVVDLDIEGAAQGDTAALARQVAALRWLQAKAARGGRSRSGSPCRWRERACSSSPKASSTRC